MSRIIKNPLTAALAGALLVMAIAAAVLYGPAAVRTVGQRAATVSMVPADPTIDATCVAEPNMAPMCRQGSYRVSGITLGAACATGSDGTAPAPTWQVTYTGGNTVRCTAPSGG